MGILVNGVGQQCCELFAFLCGKVKAVLNCNINATLKINLCTQTATLLLIGSRGTCGLLKAVDIIDVRSLV